jgi:hypothetical protein
MSQYRLRQMKFRPWVGGEIDTYGGKAIVELDGEPLYVELALVRLQEREGWEAVWIDNYRRLFRRGRADRIAVVELPTPQQELFDAITAKNAAGRAGCWDVFAWRGTELHFLEAKRRGRDRMRPAQLAWLETAAAVAPHASFTIAEWDLAE